MNFPSCTSKMSGGHWKFSYQRRGARKIFFLYPSEVSGWGSVNQTLAEAARLEKPTYYPVHRTCAQGAHLAKRAGLPPCSRLKQGEGVRRFWVREAGEGKVSRRSVVSVEQSKRPLPQQRACPWPTGCLCRLSELLRTRSQQPRAAQSVCPSPPGWHVRVPFTREHTNVRLA